MRRSHLTAALLLAPIIGAAELHVLVVEGLPGEDRYTEQFSRQVSSIERGANSLTSSERVHVLRTGEATRDAVLAHFESLQTDVGDDDQLAIFLIGHGSYDDYEYKFNLAGPDLTGDDLAAALNNMAAGTQLVVNTSSASGATAELLAADDRILVLATKSGTERHATRFGAYFAAALSDSTADIDKNEIITVREAFDFAERQVGDYFERHNQLATEHPRLHGERTERVALARLGGTRPPVVDTGLAELIAERDALNADIDALRLARDDMPLSEYQPLLLEKMLELAMLEDAIEAREAELETND